MDAGSRAASRSKRSIPQLKRGIRYQQRAGRVAYCVCRVFGLCREDRALSHHPLLLRDQTGERSDMRGCEDGGWRHDERHPKGLSGFASFNM